MKFEELTLSPNILSGLRDVNYNELTEMQEASLPLIMDGTETLIKAAPGEDKYTSFIVPALEKINNNGNRDEGTTALVLTPKSEEARGIDELLGSIGSHTELHRASICLDGDPEEQKKILASKADILVANPDPLREIMQEMRFIFRHIDLLIIDSADEMISLNLTGKIKDIVKRIMSDHQTIMYSDDANDEVTELAQSYLEDMKAIGFDGYESLSAPPTVDENISQGYIYVPNRMKITTLMAHIEDSPEDRYVIFTASKRGTDRLYRTLRKRKYKATSLHGKLSDEKRAQRFANFTNGDLQFLLVADIPASELDLQHVKRVINYDVPNDADEYRFRADLVGPGKASSIVSLVSKQDRSDINLLENKLGQAPKELPLPKKVKQKLKERRKKNKSPKKKKSKKSSKKSPKKKKAKRQNGRGKKSRKKKKEMELPQPSFDKLSGGRTGSDEDKDSKSGVIGLIKKLFS